MTRFFCHKRWRRHFSVWKKVAGMSTDGENMASLYSCAHGESILAGFMNGYSCRGSEEKKSGSGFGKQDKKSYTFQTPNSF